MKREREYTEFLHVRLTKGQRRILKCLANHVKLDESDTVRAILAFTNRRSIEFDGELRQIKKNAEARP